jgi:hypothetical protein
LLFTPNHENKALKHRWNSFALVWECSALFQFILQLVYLYQNFENVLKSWVAEEDKVSPRHFRSTFSEVYKKVENRDKAEYRSEEQKFLEKYQLVQTFFENIIFLETNARCKTNLSVHYLSYELSKNRMNSQDVAHLQKSNKVNHKFKACWKNLSHVYKPIPKNYLDVVVLSKVVKKKHSLIFKFGLISLFVS